LSGIHPMNKVHQQKYVSKYTKISKIGALVRSFSSRI
jgi:hypothetical protein